MQYYLIWILSGIILFLIYSRFIVKPAIKANQERIKEKEKMIENVMIGETVITFGGIIGTVEDIKDDTFIICSNENTFLEISQSAILQVEKRGI